MASGQQYITSYTFGSEEYNEIYVPSSPNLTTNPYLSGLPETDFIVTYEGENVPEIAKPAIEKATELWASIISTEVPIEIEISFENNVFGVPFSETALASTSTATIMDHNFESNPFDINHPKEDAQYPTALANRIANDDLYSNAVDMQIVFHLDKHVNHKFTYGLTDQATTGYDFVTIVFHEIAHGLGFESGVRDINGSIILGIPDFDNPEDYYPMIYDKFVRNVAGTKFLDEYDVNTESIGLMEFVTSDSLIWGGFQGIYGLDEAYPNNATRLHAPANFSESESISHLREDTYGYDTLDIASADNHLLLTPTLNTGEIIRSPGKRAAGMLADMGWEVSLGSTGASDHFYAIGPSEVDINTEFLIGYELIEGDNTPTYMNSPEWKLELLLENGETYTYATGQFMSNSDYYTEEITVSSLPDDVDFVRNTKGQLIARLTVSGNDSDTYYQTHHKLIKINVAPATPSVSHSIVNSNGCSAIELSFYAAGADTYRVYYQGEDDSYHYPAFVPEGQNTYILDNLDPTIDYDIFVGAYNEIDESFSASFVRPKCQISIEVYPNPTVQSIDINSDNIIDHVEVRDVLTPSIGLNKAGDGSSSDLNVNIDSLPMGTYSVKVVDQDGNMVTKTIVKF